MGPELLESRRASQAGSPSAQSARRPARLCLHPAPPDDVTALPHGTFFSPLQTTPSGARRDALWGAAYRAWRPGAPRRGVRTPAEEPEHRARADGVCGHCPEKPLGGLNPRGPGRAASLRGSHLGDSWDTVWLGCVFFPIEMHGGDMSSFPSAFYVSSSVWLADAIIYATFAPQAHGKDWLSPWSFSQGTRLACVHVIYDWPSAGGGFQAPCLPPP